MVPSNSGTRQWTLRMCYKVSTSVPQTPAKLQTKGELYKVVLVFLYKVLDALSTGRMSSFPPPQKDLYISCAITSSTYLYLLDIL